MTALINALRRPLAFDLRYFLWSHPEWWTVALCAGAWFVLLFHVWRHAGHEMRRPMPFAQELQHWLLMAAAMMLPFTLDRIRLTAEGSFWERRHRAIAEFLGGYLAPWLAVGILVAAARQMDWAHSYSAAGLAFLGAAWWQRTATCRRAVVNCHRRRPLAPDGWEADRDCWRFGALIGSACVVSCWPLMIGCAFAGHGLIALAGGMLITAIDRRSFWPRPRAILAATLALSGCYLVLGTWN